MMNNRNYGYFGKWSAFCVFAAFVALSGQACPPGMPGPASSLAGLWTGPISGDVTLNTNSGATSPPNPNPSTQNFTNRTLSTIQIVFNDAGRPTTLPLAVSAFDTGISNRAVTAFDVGEMQTISTSSTVMLPSGAAFTRTIVSSSVTTLTVIESVLAPDHFRVVYATTNTQVNTQTSTDPMFVPESGTVSSTGTLTLDALAVGSAVLFSMDFNINGSTESIEGMTMTTGSGFVVGSLAGTLGED